MDDDAIVKEAIAVLETEAQRRIQDIRQRIEFISTSLRAQCNMEISQLLLPVRQMTMREYCHRYGADTLAFLNEQTQRRRGQFPEKRLQSEHADQRPAKQRITQPPQPSPPPSHITLQFERPQHPLLEIKLDPHQSIQQLGKFQLKSPQPHVFDQLDSDHRARLREQIKDLQAQLDNVLNHLES